MVADAHALPFEDGSFDAVRTERTLQHLEDPAEAVLEMAQTAAIHKNIATAIIEREPSALRAVQALRETPVRGAVVGEVTRFPEVLVSALTEMLTADA